MCAQVAIVAGGGGELGRATAMALAAGGRSVVAVDRSERGLRDLPDGVRREVADTTDPAVAANPETLRLMIEVNLAPALWLRHAVVPHMRQQGSGVIVHVAARPGLEPAGGMAAYSVSKAALVHLTRTLDIELRPYGIRVNAVAPQLLDTPTNRALFPAEVMAKAVAPEAIGGVIAFLASDGASPVSRAMMRD